MSNPEDNKDPENTSEDTKKEKKPGALSSIFSFGNKVMDKIPEGPIMGHVIPGWMAAHKVISGIIIAGVGIPIAAIILGAGHAWYNSSYTDDYKALLDDIAKDSAIACSLEDQGRKEATYKRVQHDVRDAGDSSIFGIAMAPVSWIPYIGGIAPSFEWLPNKKIYDALDTAKQNDILFYRGNGFKGDVEAVIFNDGTNAPVLVYKDLDNGQLLAMMDTVRANNGLQQGALVLSWNDSREAYETEQVALDAETVPVMDGLSSAPMPVNSCLVDNSMTGRALEGLKDLYPFGDGGEEKETVEEHTEQPKAEEDDGGWKLPNFFGDDDEAAEEKVKPEAENTPAEETIVPEAEAEEGDSWFKMPSLPWGKDEKEEKPEAVEPKSEEEKKPAPVPAPQ